MQGQIIPQPKPGAAPTIKIGKPVIFELKNGLKVMVVENHKLPRVSFSLTLDNDPYTEGDKKDHVYTLPVLLGERRATLFLASGTFLFFLGSIFVMHTPQLFLVALLFGSFAFWVIESSAKEKGWRSFRTLPATLLVITFCYGILIAFFLR